MRVLSSSGSGPARIGLLLGKRPTPGTPLADALGLLRVWGAELELHLPHDQPGPPPWAGMVNLVVQRGLRPDVLAGLGPEMTIGSRWCDPPAATARCADRAAVAEALGRAGVPVPPTRVVHRWSTVIARAGAGPVVVKAGDGRTGRAAGVVAAAGDAVPATAPFPGPWVVQDLVPGDGRDRKLYVAGRHVRGLLKASPVGGTTSPPVPFAPPAALVALAGAAGRALDLTVFGVDVIDGPDGPVVVDVNPFPGFRGVERAGAALACHLHGLATDLDRPRCRCGHPA